MATSQQLTLEIQNGSPELSLEIERVRNNYIYVNNWPEGGEVGDVLMKVTEADDGVGWVTPANNAEEDNTRPITAAAVYMEIGNINALLATI